MIKDEILIKNAQRGDMQAFEQLVTRYDRQVLSIANSFRNNVEDAKDIYQEVFIRVFKGLKNFQFKSEFSTWLFRITSNVCISYQRKKGNLNHDSIDKEIGNSDEGSFKLADTIAGDEETDSQIFQSETARLINSALNKLPAQQRLAFSLKYYQDYKIREIAKIMNCNDGTVKRYLFVATRKMRSHLEKIIEK
jgi:RNA polymerase sigma-70 factor (ECF subfamily)